MDKMDTNQSKRRPKHSFFKFAIGKTRWKMMVMRMRDMDSHNVTRTLPTTNMKVTTNVKYYYSSILVSFTSI